MLSPQPPFIDIQTTDLQLSKTDKENEVIGSMKRSTSLKLPSPSVRINIVEDVDEGSDGSNDDDIEVRGAETTSPKWPSQRASSKIVPISAVASLVQPSSTTSKAL